MGTNIEIRVRTMRVLATVMAAAAVAYVAAVSSGAAVAVGAALVCAIATVGCFAYVADEPVAWLALGIGCKCMMLARMHRKMLARAYDRSVRLRCRQHHAVRRARSISG